MSLFKIFMIYAVLGSVVLYGTMSMFGIKFQMWEPILACVLDAICAVALPWVISGFVGFAVVMATLRWTTREGLKELTYPVVITRVVIAMTLYAMGVRFKTGAS